jgi:hypothetical protein
MSKLIARFTAKPDYKTALALVKYIDSHPMALCMASQEDIAMLETARNMVGW